MSEEVAKGKLKYIALDDIIESPVALREVDKNSEKYQELLSSVRSLGVILNAILTRARKQDDGSIKYEVIEGLHRVTAARDAGLPEIPAQVVSMDDSRVMEAQIIGNIQKVDTKPSEYREHLRRMIMLNRSMSEGQLAAKLGVSTAWIRLRLSLNKITNPEIMALIDSGKIKLSNAFVLAKLPDDEQKDYVEAACLQGNEEFSVAVNERVKELRDAKRKGKVVEEAVFEPTPHLRKISEIRSTINEGGNVTTVEGLNTPLEGFVRALEWTLHLDPESVTKQQAVWEERKAAADDRKKKRAAEIAERKADRAKMAAKLAANAEAQMKGEDLPYPDLIEEPTEDQAPVS